MSRHNGAKRSFGHDVIGGLVAGAAGTCAINAATYADIAMRGRPPSSVPEKTIEHYAQQAGVGFGSDPKAAENRKGGVASLAGFATGVGGGLAFALVRRVTGFVPATLAGIALGAGVMAFTDTSSARAGATDPSTWSPSDWLADLVPHLIYGVVTASTFDSWSRSQRL